LAAGAIRKFAESVAGVRPSRLGMTEAAHVRYR
jgi:hypothetical protein